MKKIIKCFFIFSITCIVPVSYTYSKELNLTQEIIRQSTSNESNYAESFYSKEIYLNGEVTLSLELFNEKHEAELISLMRSESLILNDGKKYNLKGITYNLQSKKPRPAMGEYFEQQDIKYRLTGQAATNDIFEYQISIPDYIPPMELQTKKKQLEWLLVEKSKSRQAQLIKKLGVLNAEFILNDNVLNPKNKIHGLSDKTLARILNLKCAYLFN